MSQDLEEMANALFNQQIPTVWESLAYPCLKGLSAWVQEFFDRMKFLNTWIENGVPSAFWVPGFYFPQAFFTGVRQNYARKYTVAIDTVSFDIKVLPEVTRDDLEKA